MSKFTAETMKAARAAVWDRIEEAADTLKRMPDRDRAMLRKSERGQEWPLMLHQACEHAAYKDIKIRMPPPDAARISRMNEVLDWLLELARREQAYFKAVWLICAEKQSVKTAAFAIGCDRKTVSKRRDAGLTLLVVDILPRQDKERRARKKAA